MRWFCAMKGSLRASLIALGFLAFTLPLMPLQWLLIKTHCRYARLLPWAYHRLLCRLLGMTFSLNGAIPAAPCLLVSNHASWLDIPLLSAVLPLSFIAKQEVNRWPLFGTMARLQRTVFIDRTRRQSTGFSADEIADRLKAGDCLVLFPEGTSSEGSGVLPFKSSYFGAVEKLDVAIIPVTVSYQGSATAWYGDMDLLPHLWEVLKSGPFSVQVTIHSPLKKADRKTMARDAETTIRQTLGEMRQIR
jgi:lyso-ornithine lipid O-acyltransferase